MTIDDPKLGAAERLDADTFHKRFRIVREDVGPILDELRNRYDADLMLSVHMSEVAISIAEARKLNREFGDALLNAVLDSIRKTVLSGGDTYLTLIYRKVKK
jgi:hypothetical protein